MGQIPMTIWENGLRTSKQRVSYTSAVKRNGLEGRGATNLQKDAERPLVLTNLGAKAIFRLNVACSC